MSFAGLARLAREQALKGICLLYTYRLSHQRDTTGLPRSRPTPFLLNSLSVVGSWVRWKHVQSQSHCGCFFLVAQGLCIHMICVREVGLALVLWQVYSMVWGHVWVLCGVLWIVSRYSLWCPKRPPLQMKRSTGSTSMAFVVVHLISGSGTVPS